jgi:hypothetical protein
MLLEFDGMMLGATDGSFVSTEGKNSGTEYKWTELQFHSATDGIFVLRTVAPVVVPESELMKVRHWSLEVTPKVSQNKVTFKVKNISGGKVKA